MLVGEYHHTIDDKSRLSLPVKFRKELGKKVVVTRGLDTCLFMFPVSSWQKIAERLAALPIGQSDTRGMSRFLLAGAVETEVDQAGRILIPEYLRNFAKLRSKVVVAGVLERVELWDSAAWKTYTTRIETKAEGMAEKLGDLGIL